MMTKRILAFAGLWLLSPLVVAASLINLAEGQATTVKVTGDVASVFISDQKVADYQVIDEHKIVVFGRHLGTTTFIAFDQQGNELRE